MHMEGGEPAGQRDDFDIEISDLDTPTPASSRGAGGGAPWSQWYRWSQQRVALPRLVLATLVAALVALALLTVLATGGQLAALLTRPTPVPTLDLSQLQVPQRSPTPQPTPTPSPYPSPTLIAPSVGPVPPNCPPSASLVPFAPDAIIPGVGGPDVWLVAGSFYFSGSPSAPTQTQTHAIAHLGSLSRSAYTPYGWPVLVQVLVASGFTQAITVTGNDLHTGYPLWLAPGPNPVPAAAAPIFTTTPRQPEGSVGDAQQSWNIWFGALYLPGAGCYTLQASWPGGGWTVHFAAGY
jgi:hypothetical protein